MTHPFFSLTLIGAIALTACSSRADTDADIAAPADDSPMADTTRPLPAATNTRAVSEADAGVLALEGIGDLVIGRPVPKGSSFAERGTRRSETCHTVRSPDYPGVYAIVEKGQIRRITIAEGSEVTLVEGVGVGAAEADVLAAFPGFRASPHKYMGAPAKYLTQPGNDPRLRFEIGESGRVSLIHAGLMPQLGYVEGCS